MLQSTGLATVHSLALGPYYCSRAAALIRAESMVCVSKIQRCQKLTKRCCTYSAQLPGITALCRVHACADPLFLGYSW